MVGHLPLGIVWTGFSNLQWQTQHNFLPCLQLGGTLHIGFGSSLHPCPCLANRNLPTATYGIDWFHRRTHRFCYALPLVFFGPFHAPRILIEFLLAFCDTAPLSSGHSPLMSSILPHYLLLIGFPWWEPSNPLRILTSPELFPRAFQWWTPFAYWSQLCHYFLQRLFMSLMRPMHAYQFSLLWVCSISNVKIFSSIL